MKNIKAIYYFILFVVFILPCMFLYGKDKKHEDDDFYL